MILHIELFRGENCWLARIAVEISVAKVLGTGVLPTPFTLQAPAHQVKARLQELNPGARIVVVEELPHTL